MARFTSGDFELPDRSARMPERRADLADQLLGHRGALLDLGAHAFEHLDSLVEASVGVDHAPHRVEPALELLLVLADLALDRRHDRTKPGLDIAVQLLVGRLDAGRDRLEDTPHQRPLPGRDEARGAEVASLQLL